MQCAKCKGTNLSLSGSDYFCRNCGLSSTQIQHELAQSQVGLARGLPGLIGQSVAQRVMADAARRQSQGQMQPQPMPASPESPTRKYRKP